LTTRGRAASPIRPGLICKRTLLGEVPLRSTGEYVTEAAIVQLFDAYKGEVERVNSLRPKEQRIKGMRYQSFYTMFRFAQLLGLVEFVREEPMEFPPPGGNLYRTEKQADGSMVVRVSNRKIFRLTASGTADEICWADLTNAWKLGRECGRPLEYIPPEQVPPTQPVPPKPKAPKVVERPEGFNIYQWSAKPTIAGFKTLLNHLYTLRELGLKAQGVAKEIDRLSMVVGGWIVETEDSLETAKATENRRSINMYGARLSMLTKLDEALMDEDLDRAIAVMEEK
jgi:hypothetical protein